MSRDRLRILLLAPGADPGSFSSSLVVYSHSEALARQHSVTLVVSEKTVAQIRRSRAPFHAVEAISLGWLDRFQAWIFRRIFKGSYVKQALTAFAYPFALAFEWSAWRRLRHSIAAGEFDVVLRVAPITATLPSLFAFFLRKGPIPFVIGPINGGLPWPTGFSQAANQKEWISGLRNLYRFFPFARSTYRNAAAIVAGSSQSCREFAAHEEKLFFVPENGISPSIYAGLSRRESHDGTLQLISVGALVPIKGCDLSLKAAAPLLRNRLAHFTLVGDGPERPRLEQLARDLGIEKAVTFSGILPHGETMKQMRAADVLLFPSIRDFGGAVVFEAMSVGAVPIVVDFGGPGDTVHPDLGYKVPLTDEESVIAGIRRILEDLQRDPQLLGSLRQRGMRYAHDNFTWDRKAEIMTEILSWAIGRSPKPAIAAPKLARAKVC